MARRSIAERLAQLDAQRKTLQARLGKQERAKDTRRKVLLGALVLHGWKSANDPESLEAPAGMAAPELPGFLTRDDDKALFADLLEPLAAGSRRRRPRVSLADDAWRRPFGDTFAADVAWARSAT